MDLKNNSGAIFKNTRKQEDRHPDYKGQINVNGQLFDIALWVKRPDGKDPYFSASISEPYKKDEPATSEPTDDLPFIITIFLMFGGILQYLF